MLSIAVQFIDNRLPKVLLSTRPGSCDSTSVVPSHRGFSVIILFMDCITGIRVSGEVVHQGNNEHAGQICYDECLALKLPQESFVGVRC